MSNLWLNIRVGIYHLQAEGFRFSISKNMIHKLENWPDGYFSIYTFYPFK